MDTNQSSSQYKLKTRPEAEDFAHKYTEEGAGKIGGKLIDNYFKTVRRLVEQSGMANVGPARAIEIGCGEGFSTQRLAALIPKNITLEASEYVAHQVPRAQANNPGLKITEEIVYDLQHESDSYDLVFLLEVLEHLDFP